MKTWVIIFITFLVLLLGSSFVLWEHSPVVSAQGQQGTTVTGTCDCNGFNVTATKIPPGPAVPPGTCIFNLKISQTYPTSGHIPKGVRLTTQSPVTFSSVIAGIATTGMTQLPTVVPNGATTVQWYGSTMPNNAPPQSLATIVFNPNGVSPQVVLVEWLDETGITMCRAILNLDCPCRNASAIAANQNICAGQTTTVTLNPLPQAGSLVTWYKANAPCPAAIPANGTPTTGWQVAQIGGNTCNTNPLTSSTCYQAVITEGPNCTYASSVATVVVSQVPSLANLTLPQNLCPSALPNGANVNTFTVNNPFTLANPSQVIWEFFNGSTWTQVGTGTSYQTLPLSDGGVCPSKTYLYRVKVGNPACGFLTQMLPIRVDTPAVAGMLVANPAGTAAAPLCYNQATKIDLTKLCSEVVQWDQSTDGGNTWSVVPGAGTTSSFWTQQLTQTTMFRVSVKNGTCGPAKSTITINVKPKLVASLSSNGTVLCNTPLTLTAATLPPIPPYPPPLTYSWYRNGVLIGTTTSPTNTWPVNQPGNYRVVISDPACGTSKSNVIRIYPRPRIVISGACGICQGGTVPLKAIVIGGDPSCAYTFNWSAPGFTATSTPGQTVNVSPNLAPGGSITYTVTTSCAGCTVTAQHTITRCPP
jgi:hypothetical protein